MLGPMDKLLLEELEAKQGFVEASQFVYSLRLKNQILESLAIDAIPELAGMGLVSVSEGTKIEITSLGKETLEKEGRLDWEEKSKITQ